ncbi:acyltransferase [Xylophilus sp. GOD-11R]|uniref:LpxL/LpxP family acyltransferase n=1 Tax=Xylophilus sp. GOD-11R TaxID=3089814 RepID=UPI00298CAFF1|nr:acyltransferase [Xylophilus sp. GOD-11R]WPB57076.1 acyltransferase [Xylophilus sp. GOD-11R]
MSAATSAPHWAALGESTCVAGIRLLYGLHRVFGRAPLRAILYPVVFWYWATRPVARRASLQYLRRLHAAHGVPARPPGWHASLRHFLSFADTIADKLLALSGRYRFENVHFRGREIVDDLLARGQGGLLVTGHVGCLELCQAVAGHQSGMRLTILVHTLHAERFNRLLRRLDPHSRVRLMQVSTVDPATAVLLGERVGRGEFIAIAGDRVPLASGKTVRVPFLGHDAPFPVGAYVLAALLKCPLLMLGCVRQGDGHLVSFDSLATRVELPRGDREAALIAHAAAFAARLEDLLVHAPYDWFNFFPFWEQPTAAPIASRTPAHHDVS